MDEECVDLLLQIAAHVRRLVQAGRVGGLDRDEAIEALDRAVRAVQRRLEHPWEAR